MKTETTSDGQQKLISSFTEIAIVQTIDTAIQFLEATNWNLKEAINLLLLRRQNQPLSNQEDEEQTPLPSVRDTLSDSSSMYQTPVQECPEEILASKSKPSDSASVGSDSTSFSSLYRPPLNLVFEGSFEDARSISYRENLWLLVNLRTTTNNLDVLSNDAVSQAIDSTFILFQVYDDTFEGQQISTFYNIESAPPVVLLIDPITGQKMSSWSGEIMAQCFLDDLMKYIDCGPHEHIASLTSNKRIKTEKICFESNHANDDVDLSTLWDDDFQEFSEGKVFIFPEKVEENCLSRNHIVSPSCGEEVEESAEVEEEETCLEFPVSAEEPEGDCDQSVWCSLCVRFPDGRRKAFKPVQAIYGDSKTTFAF